MRVFKQYARLAIFNAKWDNIMPDLQHQSAKTMANILQRFDGLRCPERLKDMLTAGIYIWQFSDINLQPVCKLITTVTHVTH